MSRQRKDTPPTVPAAPTWTHRGTEITINTTRGTFHAMVAGVHAKAPSLDAMKSKIDEAASFDPFEAYVELSGYEARRVKTDSKDFVARFGDGHVLVRRTIVSFLARDSEFVDETGDKHSVVLQAGKETIKAVKAYRDAYAAKGKAVDQHDAKISAAHDKIVHIRASAWKATP